MTARTRTAPTTPPPAKKTTSRKPTAKKTTARTARKNAAKTPTLSLVKARPELPARPDDFMTDVQGYATLAARIVGINTPSIRDWHDHHDGTATRALRDGSHLHYNQATRTLTWQALCPMGATHEYELASPSTAAAARVHADRCRTPHFDTSTITPLTADELEALGILHTPTWARPALPGEPATESIPVPLPDRQPRALADALTRSHASTTDTQPLTADEITAGLAARAADTETPKEHPQP